MGDDERAKTSVILEEAFISILESRGLIESEADLASATHWLDQIIHFILVREQGYWCILRALLDGDFHLESDVDSLGRFTGTKTLFIPRRSFYRSGGITEITPALDRDGYIIRRKT